LALPRLEIPFFGSPRGRVDAVETPSGSAYLPVTGPSALRFAPAADWPPPRHVPVAVGAIPPAVPIATEDPVAEVEPSGVEPGFFPRREITISVRSSDAARTTPATIEDAMPIRLTADVVLGYIGTLPRNDGRDRHRFTPAVPAPIEETSIGGDLGPEPVPAASSMESP
jgi:hypothetical protein